MADAETQSEIVQGPTRAVRDRGFSLVEVVVTLTLMAVVLVPIMNAVVISIKSSSQGRSAAQVETTLVNAADRVNRAPQSCDSYLKYVQAAVQTQLWAPDRGAVTHAYYKAGATPADAGEWIEGQVCQPGKSTAEQVQRVTITITSPDGDIQRKIEVVKSRV